MQTETFKNLSEVMLKVNENTVHTVTMYFFGHTQSIDVDIFLLGWFKGCDVSKGFKIRYDEDDAEEQAQYAIDYLEGLLTMIDDYRLEAPESGYDEQEETETDEIEAYKFRRDLEEDTK